jgi:aminoglycoside 6'-N-acetyltransferase I
VRFVSLWHIFGHAFMNRAFCFRIVDLTADQPDRIEQTAALLLRTFRGRSEAWQDLESARRTVVASFDNGHISRIALDDGGNVVGWIGGESMYDGHVWEIHPLTVADEHRRLGIGRALIQDLEKLVRERGALTLWAGTDDERGETSLAWADLYADIPGAIGSIRNLANHPYEFYLRVGFRVVGVMPDANGLGKPDIFVAKRVGQTP